MPARTRFAGTSTSTTTSERRERRSTGTYDVLATLRRSGEPFQLTPGALGGSLMLSTGGMTGRLDRLEQAGLVTRCPGPGDRRSRLVTLTDRGRQLIDQALDAGVETQGRLLADLPPGRRQQLNGLLRDLLTVVTREASLPPASPARRSVPSETREPRCSRAVRRGGHRVVQSGSCGVADPSEDVDQ